MDPVKVTMTYQDPNDPTQTITEVVPEVSCEHVMQTFAGQAANLMGGPWVTLTPVTELGGKHLVVNVQGSSLDECQPIEAFDQQRLFVRWPRGKVQLVTIALTREVYTTPARAGRREVVSYMPGFYEDLHGAMIWIPLYKVQVLKAWADEHRKTFTGENS